MDKNGSGDIGFFRGIGEGLRCEFERRKRDGAAMLFDIIVFMVAFVFSRYHLAFGSYPLGVAFVSALPRSVFGALFGCILGVLTLGRSGVIHAVISVIAVVLRVIISGTDKEKMFSEAPILRIATAAVGSFVSAVYEVLLSGFSISSLLFGLVGVVFSALLTFAFLGVFDSGISFLDVLYGSRDIFARKEKAEDKFSDILFQASFLVIVFFVSLSLKEYEALGISASYIFASFITLFVAKRFGVVRGMVVGFVTSLGISGVYAVSFALLGVVSGALFEFGSMYALSGGAIAVAAWAAYAGGLMGFLTVFPEYVSAALIFSPFAKKLRREIDTGTMASKEKAVKDMVISSVMSYKTSAKFNTRDIEESLLGIARALRSFGRGEGDLSESDVKDYTIEAVGDFCKSCPNFSVCTSSTPAPCFERIDDMAKVIYKNDASREAFEKSLPDYCVRKKELLSNILGRVGEMRQMKYKNKGLKYSAESFDLISKIIGEMRSRSERECEVSSELSEKITEELVNFGLIGGAASAIGERQPRFFCAAEDKDGIMITSPALMSRLEVAAGVRLTAPEYYREGDYALFECGASPSYAVEYGYSGAPSPKEDISGDSASFFTSKDGKFYAVISDGMGSGESANSTSRFAVSYLSSVLSSGAGKSTALHMLNSLIKSRSAECSASVDIFEFDTLLGEAVFYKCGAAVSYIKRDKSIFRIKSETCPIGLMDSVDAERVRVEVKAGDYIVMISDGVSQTTEDSIWLLELLSEPAKRDPEAYAKYLMEMAKKHSETNDDMTVSVIRISEIASLFNKKD